MLHSYEKRLRGYFGYTLHITHYYNLPITPERQHYLQYLLVLIRPHLNQFRCRYPPRLTRQHRDPTTHQIPALQEIQPHSIRGSRVIMQIDAMPSVRLMYGEKLLPATEGKFTFTMAVMDDATPPVAVQLLPQ